MKYKFLTLILIYSVNFQIQAESKSLFLIVTGSNLNCRSDPNINSKIISMIPFGMPLEVNEVLNEKITINKITSFWYKIKPDDCWVFGGYTKQIEAFKSEINLFNMEFVYCNIGGGIGFGFPFEPLIIGDHFISAGLYNSIDSPSPYNSVVIGIVEKNQNGYKFIPNIEGVYERDGSWKGTYKASDYIKSFAQLIQKNDKNGNYYSYKDSKFDRIMARKLCKEKSLEEVYESYYTIENISINKARKLFPIIRPNQIYSHWNK